eukprot:4452195-Amphidinium_carterae.1
MGAQRTKASFSQEVCAVEADSIACFLEAWPEDNNVEFIGTAPSIPKSVQTESACPDLELEITLTREDTSQRLGLDVKHLGRSSIASPKC